MEKKKINPVFKASQICGFDELDWYPTPTGTAFACRRYSVYRKYDLESCAAISPFAKAIDLVNKLIGGDYKILSLFEQPLDGSYGIKGHIRHDIVILTNMPESKFVPSELPIELRFCFRFANHYNIYGKKGEDPVNYYAKGGSLYDLSF